MAANGSAMGSPPPEPRRFNDVFSGLPTTVFEEMSLLAAQHQSVNLVGAPVDICLYGNCADVLISAATRSASGACQNPNCAAQQQRPWRRSARAQPPALSRQPPWRPLLLLMAGPGLS